jgi:serine/threonine protein kinase
MGAEADQFQLVVIEPSRLGPYLFRGVIGEGAFSRVRLIVHERTSAFYACKIIPKDKVGQEDVSKRFEVEIRTNQTLHHPGIVQLYDLLMDDNNYYVIIEFCPNGDLFHYIITRSYLPEDDARIFTREVLESLSYVHSMGISHRDLKPENLLLDHNGILKISDFGLAQFMGANSLVSTMCGSPCYASPECLSGRPYDGTTSDVWSLGVVVYAMVTGALPWTETDQIGIFRQICTGQFRIPGELSPKCRSFLGSLMTVDNRKRSTVAEALRHPWIASIMLVWPE